MRSVTLLIYLDACRHDYITEDNTPFLYDLSKRAYFGRVETVPGFTQEIAMMTGKYPDETGYFNWYRYNPSGSPFTWVKPFKFLSVFRRSRLYYPIKLGIRAITAFAKGTTYPSPEFIPLEILPYFERIASYLPEHIPNLLSLCHSHNLHCYEQTMIYDLIGTKRYKELFTKAKEVMSEHYDLCVLHIGDLDGLGHKHGPHPDMFRDHLMGIDGWINILYDVIKGKGINCNLIVTSDHGMFDVKGDVDIERMLKSTKLVMRKDYIYFLDSTMARFWIFNEEARTIILDLLSKIKEGHIVSEGDKKKMHIDFKHNDYGEIIFWLDKGYMVFPNFYQSFGREKTKGMHGYIDDKDGAILIYLEDDIGMSDIMKDDVMPLVNVFDIVYKSMAKNWMDADCI